MRFRISGTEPEGPPLLEVTLALDDTGALMLQARLPGDSFWYEVLRICPDGCLYRRPGLPTGLRLKLDAYDRILLRNNIGLDYPTPESG